MDSLREYDTAEISLQSLRQESPVKIMIPKFFLLVGVCGMRNKFISL